MSEESTTSLLVLAGGQGTRLRSVISDVPKPMAPVLGKPFLEYVLDYWFVQGVRRFVLSVGYRGDVIQDHFGDRYRAVPIEYVFERSPLGTGGAMRFAFDSVQLGGGPLIMVNGDTWCEVGPQSLLSAAQRTGCPMTMAVVRVDSNDRYTAIGVGSDCVVTKLGDPDHVPALINAGCYLIQGGEVQEALRSCPEAFSFEKELLPRLVDDRRVAASIQACEFIDIGVPDDYRRVGAIFDRRGDFMGDRH